MTRRPDPGPGVCRLCGCVEDNACQDEHGDSCAWADRECTLCTHCEARGGPPEGYPASAEEWQAFADAVGELLPRALALGYLLPPWDGERVIALIEEGLS